jgi:hypothetical protein
VELFTIQCTTCKARLIVKDESVIGDILSCPKCNSMVQVVPPIGWQGRTSGASSPGELVSAPAAAAPARSKPSPASALAKKTAAAAIPPALPPKAAAATPSPKEVAPSVFAAAAAWAQRDWIVLTSGLVGGVVLGSVIWLVAAVQSPPQTIVADAAEASTSQQAAKPATPPAPMPTPAKQESTGTSPQPAPTTNEAENLAPEKPETGEPQTTETAPADDAAQPPAEEKAAQNAAPEVAAKKSGPALKLEPIPSSGDGRSGIGTFLAPQKPTPSAGNDAPAEPAADDQKSPDVSAPTASAPSPGESAALEREEIEKRLAVSLTRVDFAEVSLAQFAVFVGDIAGVKVTIDDAALAKVGKGRRTPLTVKLDQTTAGEALRAALERLGLVYTIDDGRIVVSVARE